MLHYKDFLAYELSRPSSDIIERNGNKSNVSGVYTIPYRACNKNYMGETSRLIKKGHLWIHQDFQNSWWQEFIGETLFRNQTVLILKILKFY